MKAICYSLVILVQFLQLTMYIEKKNDVANWIASMSAKFH